jgi:hypothetical protein
MNIINIWKNIKHLEIYIIIRYYYNYEKRTSINIWYNEAIKYKTDQIILTCGDEHLYYYYPQTLRFSAYSNWYNKSLKKVKEFEKFIQDTMEKWS